MRRSPTVALVPGRRRRAAARLAPALLAVLAAADGPAQAGGRYGGRGGGAAGRATASNTAVHRGLDWLARHQDEAGRLSASMFLVHDPKAAPTDGAGGADQDVQVTALALLAWLGSGTTSRSGEHRDAVRRAVAWLTAQQDDDGAFGDPARPDGLFAHALASYAVTEAAGLGADVGMGEVARHGLERLIALRSADGGWRRRAAADAAGAEATDHDTTVTAILALAAARFFGLPSCDLDAAVAALQAAPDRPAGGEAMARFFIGQSPKDTPRLAELTGRLGQAPPRWPADAAAAATADQLDWLLGAMAAYQSGGPTWKQWSARIQADLLPRQREDGSFAGSWDPLGPRGKRLGRVGSTALMTLLLQTYHRYTRMVR